MAQSPDDSFEQIQSGARAYKLYDSIYRHLCDRQHSSVVTVTIMVVDKEGQSVLGVQKHFRDDRIILYHDETVDFPPARTQQSS